MSEINSYLKGDFDVILRDIDNAVTKNSLSATLEGASNFRSENSRCAVRVYERYSMFGKNRVSLSVTLIESDGKTYISAITSGGSQAVLVKINTIGEDAFLETIRDTIKKYSINYGRNI